MVKGDRDTILQAFMRVERFITKIAGKKIFDFEPEPPTPYVNKKTIGQPTPKHFPDGGSISPIKKEESSLKIPQFNA